jgi:hypothetical protein
MKTVQTVTSALVLASMTFLSAGSLAQEVAFHDLGSEKSVAPPTRTWAPRPEACPKTDDQFIDIMCGSMRPPEPGNLFLKIEDVQPSVLHLGDSYEITVRLKNVGKTNARVPWLTSGPDAMQVSADGATASHQEAAMSVRLESRGKSSWIGDEVNLYANPAVSGSYTDLAPGEWVTIHLKGRVECTRDFLCKNIPVGSRAKLNAQWFEYLYERTVRDCVAHETNLTARKIESKPVRVAVEPAYPATARR